MSPGTPPRRAPQAAGSCVAPRRSSRCARRAPARRCRSCPIRASAGPRRRRRSPARARSDPNCARVSSSVASGPSRSVRPALPTSRLPAGQHRRRSVRARREDVPGQVLRRMTRGRARNEPQATDLDGVAFVGVAMLECVSTTGRRHDLDAPIGAKLQGARQVVVVDVGLDRVGEPPAARIGHGRHAPGVARRIDHDGLPVRGEEIRRIAQAGREDDLEIHGATGYAPGQSRTRGGLSRSNMWTVSTKRTCLVW